MPSAPDLDDDDDTPDFSPAGEGDELTEKNVRLFLWQYREMEQISHESRGRYSQAEIHRKLLGWAIRRYRVKHPRK